MEESKMHTTDAVQAVAKFKVGEKVRLTSDHNNIFVIKLCTLNPDNNLFYYSPSTSGEKQFTERALDFCPTLVKKKYGFWMNVYINKDNEIYTGFIKYRSEKEAKRMAKHEASYKEYLYTNYFETEFYVDETWKI